MTGSRQINTNSNRSRPARSTQFLLLVLIATLAGCSSSRKVEVVQRDDAGMNCQQLRQEFARLDDTQAEIVNNRGSGNLAGLIFWLPGVAFSEADADKALALVRERRDHLNGLYRDKGCDS